MKPYFDKIFPFIKIIKKTFYNTIEWVVFGRTLLYHSNTKYYIDINWNTDQSREFQISGSIIESIYITLLKNFL